MEFNPPLCLCGCGRELVGRRTKWATDRCRAKSSAERDKTTERTTLLRSRYDMSPEEFKQILDYQGGKCALCGKPNSSRRNHSVDHDHKTFAVRGILCFRCNAHVVGNLTLELVEAILDYLRNPPAEKALGYVKIANPESNARRKRKRKRQPRKMDRRTI